MCARSCRTRSYVAQPSERLREVALSRVRLQTHRLSELLGGGLTQSKSTSLRSQSPYSTGQIVIMHTPAQPERRSTWSCRLPMFRRFQEISRERERAFLKMPQGVYWLTSTSTLKQNSAATFLSAKTSLGLTEPWSDFPEFAFAKWCEEMMENASIGHNITNMFVPQWAFMDCPLTYTQ